MLKITLKGLLVVGCWWVSVLQAGPQYVARVSMTVGDAQRVSASGHAEPLLLGAELSEQDRIITGKDAMVILIFSDQARVALRPDSELLIRRYKVDPNGTETQLDLDLLRGTVRQISGHAAHKQPERYRLNTPIAVIGVRGTDFLAKTGAGVIEAYVHEGSIIVSPYADIGSLNEAPSARLGAGYGVHYSRATSSSKLEHQNVAQEDIERLFGIRIATSSPFDNEKAGARGSAVKTEPIAVASLFSVKDKDATGLPAQASTTMASNGGPPLLLLPPVTALPGPAPTDSVPMPLPTDSVPMPLPTDSVPLPLQLVWGRFSNPQMLPFTLSQSYQDAKEGRHTTVGELGQYALWRTGANGPLDKSLRGQAQFALAAGEAFYQQGGKTVALSMTDPKLQVDFDRLNFNTQLGLSGAGAPGQLLNVSGRMNDEGVFLGSASGQTVAGALSRNGAEAGYMFKIGNGAGQYQGITLWNAK